MRPSCTFVVSLAIAAALAAHPAPASDDRRDDNLEFLQRMQKQGFADVAIDYLNALKDDPKAPESVMRIWDLEMSKSKRALAMSAYNAAEAKRLNEESKALLEKFIKDNPDMSEAVVAAADYSVEQAMQAQYQVLRAQAMTDQAERAAVLAAARKTFEEVLPPFQRAKDAAVKHYAAVVNSPRATPPQKRDAYFSAAESRLKLAMVEFYLALTEENAAERDAKFSKVAKDFEDIYRIYGEHFIGWEAHYWNARILQEQGRNQDARDYYEEVQANDEKSVPDSTAGDKQPIAPRAARLREPGAEDYFFSEVERQLLKVLYAVDPKEYYKEVDEWRKNNKLNREKCPEYQGLTLDYARYLAKASEAAKDSAKRLAYKRNALALLKEMASIPSPYQPDAVDLRRRLDPNALTKGSFDDFVADGNKALGKKDWATAAEFFAKALEAAAAKNAKIDKDRLTEARNAYVACIYNEATELYKRKKVDEAVDQIKTMLDVPEYRATAAAPAAAIFALNIRYYQLRDAKDGSEILRRAAAAGLSREAREDLLKEAKKERANWDSIEAKVVELAKSIIDFREWTAREEADAARINLLRIALAKCDVAEAVGRVAAQKAADANAIAMTAKADSAKAKAAVADAETAVAEAKAAAASAKTNLDEADRIFKGINVNSRKYYSEALTILGWKHWQKYRLAKKAWDDKNDKTPPDKATQDQLEEDHKLAVDYTEKAVDNLAGASRSSPMPKELRDAKLLLGEIYADNDAKKAVGQYKDLVADILADPDIKSLDDTTLRVFNGAIQVYLQLNDMKSASVLAEKLLELGPDATTVNLSIVNFAKRLDLLRRQGGTELDAAGKPTSDQQAVLDLETKILANLAKRDKLAPLTMVWLVQLLSKLGTDEADAAATQLSAKIFDRAADDNNFDKQVAKHKAALHALASNIEAKHGNYEKAFKDIDALIQQNPRVLPPLMARAQILTEWAVREPAKYGEAISAWHNLATRLERVKVKVNVDGKEQEEKMPEYYEALYNECLCFHKMAEKTKDKSLAKKGLELLIPVLNFDPKLQGPKRDRELVFKFYQLAGQLAAYAGEPRPVPPKK